MPESESLSDHTVAVYHTHSQAEGAIMFLRDAGIDMKHTSIIGQDYATEEHPIGFINSGDRMLTWGKFGAFWGTIWGLLFGSAMIFVPGLGYLLFGGWLVAALEGAVVGGGIAALGGAFASIGIPNDSIVKYEQALKAGKFIVIVHSDTAEAERAKAALTSTSAGRIDSYSNKHPEIPSEFTLVGGSSL